MNVKAFLAQEDGNFICLDDVLHGLMRANDCSYKEAATALLRLLNRDSFSPAWFSKNATDGVRKIERDVVPMGCLKQAAQLGEPIDDDIPF